MWYPVIRRVGWRGAYVSFVLRVSDMNVIKGGRNCSGGMGVEGYNIHIRHSHVPHGPDARGGAGGGHTL